MKIIKNYQQLSQIHKVSRFAPYEGQNQTIDLFQTSVKFSSYENAREKLLLLLYTLYVKESI